MKCNFGPTLPEAAKGIFTATLSRFPDEYEASIALNGNTYTVWIRRGDLSYYYAFSPMKEDLSEKDVATILDGAHYGVKCIHSEMDRNPKAVTENQDEGTVEDYIKLRLDDFRRSMPESKIEEKLQAGELPGLEFMKGRL